MSVFSYYTGWAYERLEGARFRRHPAACGARHDRHDRRVRPALTLGTDVDDGGARHGRPHARSRDAWGRWAFVPNMSDGTVTQIDRSTGKTVATISVADPHV